MAFPHKSKLYLTVLFLYALLSWKKSQKYFKNEQKTGETIWNNSQFAAVRICTPCTTFSRKKVFYLHIFET